MAAKILPIVKHQHVLLCTLLIGNALAMEALPIFLDVLLPAWASVLISVTLILAFGEVGYLGNCKFYNLFVAPLACFIFFCLVSDYPSGCVFLVDMSIKHHPKHKIKTQFEKTQPNTITCWV